MECEYFSRDFLCYIIMLSIRSLRRVYWCQLLESAVLLTFFIYLLILCIKVGALKQFLRYYYCLNQLWVSSECTPGYIHHLKHPSLRKYTLYILYVPYLNMEINLQFRLSCSKMINYVGIVIMYEKYMDNIVHKNIRAIKYLCLWNLINWDIIKLPDTSYHVLKAIYHKLFVFAKLPSLFNRTFVVTKAQSAIEVHKVTKYTTDLFSIVKIDKDFRF